MTETAGERRADHVAVRESDEPTVNTYETRPGRTVFTESENTDGWISTDTTVAVSQ